MEFPCVNMESIFEDRSGFYEGDTRLNMKVFIALDVDDIEGESEETVLNNRKPAIALVTEDLPGPGETFSIVIHKSVPERYLVFVIFHELVEAEHRYINGFNLEQAHNNAKSETDLQVNAKLSGPELQKYRQWESGLIG